MSEDPAEAKAIPPGRQRCPTCGAARRDDAVCYRCKTDLAPLIAIERRADALRVEARRCYALGWYRRAVALLREIVSVEATAEDYRLLACACVHCGDFPTACQAYRRLVHLDNLTTPADGM